ncbi:hypothetical protein ACFQHN_26450 [Natrialbaceae archaeon GCM10025896]
MFEEYDRCPNCTVRRVDPDERDDDVRTIIRTCDRHSLPESGGETAQ